MRRRGEHSIAIYVLRCHYAIRVDACQDIVQSATVIPTLLTNHRQSCIMKISLVGRQTKCSIDEAPN